MDMRRLNLGQVSAFLSVVRLGGVRKAAQSLYLTQPAVTTRIKNLEESLSTELFDRTTLGLKLTKEGELFLRYAEGFEHLSDQVEKNIIDPASVEGYLRLGASETIAQCWLPDFVSRLHRKYPNIQVEINVDISLNLRAALLDRQIDLALLLGPISEYSVDNIELPEFDLAWYASAAFVKHGDDPSSYLARPIVTYARNTRPYRELKALLLEHVGPGVALFPSSSLSACFRLVEAGIGVAALPRALARPYTENGAIVEFDPGWTPSPLTFTASYLGEPKTHMLEIAAKTALEAARDHAGIKLFDANRQK
ncbi:MAG: LysR family transcriptional regulator [Rhizobiaceae bacterium]